MEEKAMTTQEVAKFLNISNQMVYNLIKNEMLTSFKVGNAVRVLTRDLNDYIDRQKAFTQSVNRYYTNAGMDVFSVQNLCAHKGTFSLNKISFDFPLGRTISILGPSGCGKTLLLKSIAGLELPDAGAIFSGPTRIDQMSVGERRLGFVFQDYALYPHMDSNANIGFPHMVRKMSKAQIDGEVAHIVAKLGIPEQFLTKKPDILPEGIKHLVAIAHAQSNALDLYVMDEPMSHLDTMVKKEMRVFLKALVTDLGKTTIFAFNDPEDALSLSDYVCILDRGRVVQSGPVAEVYEHPSCPVALESLSIFGTVRIPVEVKDGTTSPFSIAAEGADGVYTMHFRPDELIIAGDGAIGAEICSSRFVDGSHMVAKCLLDEKLPCDLILPPDTGTAFRFTPKKVYFFPV